MFRRADSAMNPFIGLLVILGTIALAIGILNLVAPPIKDRDEHEDHSV